MELPCDVKYVSFRNDSGFAILSCNLDKDSARYKSEMDALVEEAINPKYKSFTVTLSMLPNDENPSGGQYVFVGDFVVNPKYGKQFKADFYYQDEPTTEDGMRAFLMTLPNIKEQRSQAIIDKFGVDGVAELLDNNPEQLLEINGINAKRLPAIKAAWDERKYLRELYTWLTSHSIQIGLADKIYKEWGKKSLQVLNENPYRLVELRGVGFVTADKAAHKILDKVPFEHRIYACVKYVLDDNLVSNSNLCMPYGELKANVVSTLTECDYSLGNRTDTNKILAQIPLCLKAHLDEITVVKNKDDNQVFVYFSTIWDKECYIASELWKRKEFDNSKNRCTASELENAERDLGLHYGRKIVLDDTQKDAIVSAFEHKITIITGGAGTGKSTICKAVCDIAKSKGMSIRLMSPTGKAAQVLAAKTDSPASTIHRSLKMVPDDELPRENITESIVVVDEISMVGIDTMYAIMTAMEDNMWGNMVLVGDKNQLPSVSPGNFLSDIIDSGCAHVVTLDKVHRQDENSYITVMANDIALGKVANIPATASDIKWTELDTNTFGSDLLGFLDRFEGEGGNLDDLQIISPMKKGLCGVYAINELLQKRMCEKNKTQDRMIQRGFSKFYVGDRVIQIANNYDKMVFNGDMGSVVDVGEKPRDAATSDKKEKFVIAEFYGEQYTYFGEDIDELHLAWACTVHKYQGSQARNIVFILANEAQIMVNKELVYTAFSRAEKMLYIYGNNGLLRMASGRSAVRKRYTNMDKMIMQLRDGQQRLIVLETKKA